MAILVVAAVAGAAIGSLGISPSCLYFSPGVDSISVEVFPGADDWTVTSNAAWLSVDPTSGTGNGSFWAKANRAGFIDGTYEGTLTVTAGADTRTVAAELVVASGPVVSVTATSLNFSPAVTNLGFGIRNIGVGTLNWALSVDVPWIHIDPESGTGDLGIAVFVDQIAIPPGPQTGHITVTSDGGPATVAVHYDPASTYFPGVIGLYADAVGTDCNINFGGPGLVTIHVVHTRTAGATAVQWAAPKPACWTNAIFLSDTDPFPLTIGDSQCGKSNGYGACLSGPIHISSINYFVPGPPTNSCCLYPVVPDRQIPSGEIEIVDCDGNLHSAQGGLAMLYPDANCQCNNYAVPVEKQTWGRAKSLYR